MTKFRYLTVAAMMALLALVGCSAEGGNDDAATTDAGEKAEMASSTTATIDQPAPDFTLTDSEGTVHSLSDFKGQYVILEWINFDCPFVKKHYSVGNMQKYQTQYQENGAVWLTICSSAPGKQGYFEGEELTSRMDAEGWAGTAYLADPTGKVGKMYGATNTPHMYVINPEGVLVYAGAIDDTPSTKSSDIPNSVNYVEAAMTASMNDQPIDTKATAAYGCSVKYP